jgi:hypothetical protein
MVLQYQQEEEAYSDGTTDNQGMICSVDLSIKITWLDGNRVDRLTKNDVLWYSVYHSLQ